MKKNILAIVIAVAAFASPISNAASVSFSPNATSGNITATVDFGTLSFDYSGSNIISNIIVMDQFPNNSYNNVGDKAEIAFGLPANTFSSEAIVDIASDFYKGDISGSTATIVSDMAYDYLAIHFGGYEAFFQFATLYPANTAFTISKNNATTKGGGLSNYRVYDSGLSEVPVPAALFMFAPALLGLMGFRRRAKNLTA